MAADFPSLPFQNASPASSEEDLTPISPDSSPPIKAASYRRPFFPVHQRTLSLPSPSLVPSHHGLKRKFDLAMQPVPEEDYPHLHEDTQDDDIMDTESSESATSTSSSRHTSVESHKSSSGNDSSGKHELRHPYKSDPARLAMELEHVKQIHEQDKQFFQRENRNLRMLLFEAESNLQDRTGELEYILQEKEAEEKWEWEARREREAADELRERNRMLMAELDMRRKEYADLMDVLEETQNELLGVPAAMPVEGYTLSERRSSGSLSTCSGGGGETGNVSGNIAGPSNLPPNSPPSPPASSLGRYSSIPSRVASLRKRVLENEERFQAGYSAWSSENKYLRKLHQVQLKAANDDLRKSREETQALAAENKKLLTRVGGLKESLVISRKESVSVRRSRELQTSSSAPLTPDILPPMEDKISLENANKLVQKLNMRIADTAAVLAKNLASANDSSGISIHGADRKHPERTQEAVWLLGGKDLTSQLTFVPSPSSSKDNVALRTLIQIGLTTWSGHHVHSWDLQSKAGPSSSYSESHMGAIYRKLKTTEDPSTAATWRSLARAQIRFSSTAWTQALISSIHSIFSFLGLTYTQPMATMAQDLQPLLASIRSLREAAGELVVSKELEVATVMPGTMFNPRHMKDFAFSRSSGQKSSSVSPSSSLSRAPTRRRPELVVATCGLGLKDSERLVALPQVLRNTSLRELMVSVP